MNAEQQRLISDNYGLIVKVASSFVSSSVVLSREDLIQEGFYGICRVIDKFDPKRGKYSTFATVCARNAILKKLKYVRPLPVKYAEDSYDQKTVVEDVMPTSLTQQQRDIVKLRSQGYTQTEICKLLSIMPHHFRTLQQRAFNRMRRSDET
jgi:RNA polymerase sigma factor (sigma-70 family)